ncbi:hypothetical protein BOX15_Mlig017097g1 [Macrostomum lignano]|uniref:Uncharacterized protein n=2 Tax=Macrostomum lignano TaxID=282301 RepID=A0A267DLJ2_9PLAT|nr:hypothetical protein BOX15_Mlig017097g2 [Macrostomum lignano]PAA88313.1 hypothetical protein BOX15_Mlig017097g1 [Macrostomum lignano]
MQSHIFISLCLGLAAATVAVSGASIGNYEMSKRQTDAWSGHKLEVPIKWRKRGPELIIDRLDKRGPEMLLQRHLSGKRFHKRGPELIIDRLD